MIVHQCTNCGHVSRNRIAGDDNPSAITALLDLPTDELNYRGINLVTLTAKSDVLIALFGYNYNQFWQED